MNFDEKLLFKIVKTGFQQRRKTLRNSLKSLNILNYLEDSIFDLRPEKLSAAQFIELTKKLGMPKYDINKSGIKFIEELIDNGADKKLQKP